MSSTSTNRFFWPQGWLQPCWTHLWSTMFQRSLPFWVENAAGCVYVHAFWNTRFMEGYGIMDILQHNPDAVQIKKWQVIWCSSMDRLITSIQAGAAAELWETILSQLRDDFRRIQVQRAAQSRVALNSLQMDVATLARIMMDGSFAIQGPKQPLHWQCQKNPELTTWQNQETI